MTDAIMKRTPNKTIASPDKRHDARLYPEEGASWEMSSASVELAGLSFGSRRFRWHGIWSPCSRYFAISEWRSSDYDQGPDMHLLVIDVAKSSECVVIRAEEGFVDPVYIHDGELKYSIITSRMLERGARFQRIDALTGWRKVAGTLPEAPGRDV